MRWLAIVLGFSLLLTACASRRGTAPSQTFPVATPPPIAAGVEPQQPAPPAPVAETAPTPSVAKRSKPTPSPTPSPASPTGSTAPTPAIVTPANPLIGRISSVNSTARFVVLTYSIGNVPAVERRLNVYRQGLKVAELKVTGPSQDINTVADILAGECQVGDEVREN